MLDETNVIKKVCDESRIEKMKNSCKTLCQFNKLNSKVVSTVSLTGP